jgi:hypothetical protein
MLCPQFWQWNLNIYLVLSVSASWPVSSLAFVFSLRYLCYSQINSSVGSAHLRWNGYSQRDRLCVNHLVENFCQYMAWNVADWWWSAMYFGEGRMFRRKISLQSSDSKSLPSNKPAESEGDIFLRIAGSFQTTRYYNPQDCTFHGGSLWEHQTQHYVQITGCRLSHWPTVDDKSVLGLLHGVDVGDFADVPEVHPAYIFRAKVCKQVLYI